MKPTICGKSGSLLYAERKVADGLNPTVRRHFTLIMTRLNSHLKTSRLALCAPPSERWLTIRASPRKAVIAFIDEADGRLRFDIDTYADNDIIDQRKLLQFIPDAGKPNKRHVGYISPETPDDVVGYFIEKMLEGMRKFDQ